MKESEKLYQQAHAEDNDLKHLGLYKKAKRAERMEKFIEIAQPILEKNFSIDINERAGRVSIETVQYGVIDYYPKSDRLLIRKDNDWKTFGCSWISKNLINIK